MGLWDSVGMAGSVHFIPNREPPCEQKTYQSEHEKTSAKTAFVHRVGGHSLRAAEMYV